MTFRCFPEYEFFTSVNIELLIDGDNAKNIVVSRVGEHFQSLTIREGAVSEGGVQVQEQNRSGGVASGTIVLYDEDNSIFLSLVTSKTSEGKQILTQVKITIKTYTGSRTYLGRVEKWNCSFSGGCPTISISWQQIGNAALLEASTQNQLAYDSDLLMKLLVKEGVQDFKEFKEAMLQVFKNTITFKYAPSKLYSEESLLSVPDSGLIVVEDSSTRVEYQIAIPDSVKVKDNTVFRFDLKPSDWSNILGLVMDRFCAAVNSEPSGVTNLKLDWFKTPNNSVVFYTYGDQRIVPQPSGSELYLQESVFVYNSAMVQGSLYTLPNGSTKKVFIVDSINTTYDNQHIIAANFSSQANIANPNGNMVLTSRGVLTLPSNLPQTVAQSIRSIASLNLTDQFTVTFSCYNFIHFYVCGETPVYLLVFDHLGRVHPMTGTMRVHGYSYSLNKDDGVIKANVTLKPLFAIKAEAFPPFNSDQTMGYNSYSGVESSYNQPINSDSFSKVNLRIDLAVDYIGEF